MAATSPNNLRSDRVPRDWQAPTVGQPSTVGQNSRAGSVDLAVGSSCRRAFTLVELLVVIAIIGILIALLLPAVNSAREASRRLQCTNNLKQIGYALHSYNTANGSFPVNMTGSGPEVAPGKWGTGLYSWFVPLLPYLDQGPLYSSMDLNVNMADLGNAPYNPRISADHRNALAAATIVPTFLCPSATYQITALMGTAKPAPGSYVANVGWPPYSTGMNGDRPTPAKHNGFIGLVHPTQKIEWHVGTTSPRQFTDGLSNTIACSERLITSIKKAAELDLGADKRVLSLCAGSGGTRRTLAGYYEYAKLSHTDITQTKLTGRAWISGSAIVGNTFMTVMPINSFNAHFDDASDGNSMFTPSSEHPDGVNILMGDGSARFLVETVDMKAYWAMGSRNGAEVVAGSPH